MLSQIASIAIIAALYPLFRRVPRRWGRAIVLGSLFGVGAIAGMLMPVEIDPGFVFDLRAVPLGVAGFFGGPIVGLVASAIAGAFRLWLGGGGAPTGIVMVFVAFLCGLSARLWIPERQALRYLNLIVLGAALAGTSILGLWVLLPSMIMANFMTFYLPMIAGTLIGTTLLGGLLLHEEDRIAALVALRRALRKKHKLQKALSIERGIVRTLFEGWPEFIYLKDPDGRFLAANAAMAAHLGRTHPDDLIGHGDDEFLKPDDAALFRSIEREVMEKGEGIVGYLEHFMTPSGRECWVSSTKLPSYDDEGRLIGVLGIGRDVTPEIQVQHELEAAKTKAEEANRVKAAFLANMSHELRTPLNAVIGFSDLMQQAVVGPLTTKQREYIADINGAGRALLNMVENLLRFSTLEAGRFPIHEDWIDAVEVIRDVGRLVRPAVEKGGIDYSESLGRDLPLLYADRLALVHMVQNLLVNAVKFTAAGGSVRVEASIVDGAFRIAVADTGIGISEEALAEVMEPFAQGDDWLNKRHEGVGLGLAITLSLAKLHDARLVLESRQGEGTTASLHFPPDRVGQTSLVRTG
ncbi:LytS/YhcK type 5TM receptor domain-containing protein [Inquilinus sp. CAU 1745]|uniref:ATP-binding protein n=1 Tax=Inquilinus sp. CAU 1745 TaxID=3140369 RepID=UPI00325AF7EC